MRSPLVGLFVDLEVHVRLSVPHAGHGADAIEQVDPNTYKALTKVNTANGARTGLFVPAQHMLFVAVPHHGSQQAEIRVYQTE